MSGFDLNGNREGCVDLSVTGDGWSLLHLGGWRWGGVAVPSLPFTLHPLPRLHACHLQASSAVSVRGEADQE